MTTKSAAAAPEGKRYKYYGREYRMSVKDMAAAAKVSLRLQKDVLKLHGLGYQDAIAQGYTMAECFAHAGVKRSKRRATPKVDDLDDAVYEIKRLREMLHDLGVDPDG